MKSVSLSHAKIRRGGARLVFGAVLLASIGGLYAFRMLAARPGEGALRLIPEDALAVVTVDLSASVSQTLAFKHIDDALARNNLNSKVDGSWLEMFERGAQGVEALRPLLLRNGAIALIPGPNGGTTDCKGIAYFAVRDGAEAQAIVAKNGAVQYWKGLKYYKLKNGHSAVLVVDDLLVAAETPQALYRVKQVRDGQALPLTTNAAFQAARSHVADDANVMAFVSPKMAQDTGVKAADGAMSGWFSCGLAVRDGGLGFSFGGTLDTKLNPDVAQLGKTPPLRADLFKILPAGAYGAFAVSQPSNYYESVEPTLKKDDSARKSLAEMKDEMQKNVGMDFQHDFLPALRGNVVMAAYPQSISNPTGVDLLLVIDDLNGADPANAVDRFQSWVQRQLEKEGNKQPLWSETKTPDARMFRLSGKSESDLRSSLGNGMDEGMVDKKALVGSKTVAWAVVGKGVIAATSQELLDRALVTYHQGGTGLNADPKFAAVESEALNGSQSLAMFSLSRIAEGIRNTVRSSKMDADGKKTFDGILNVIQTLDQPFLLHTKVESNGQISGGVFIPLDYDKTIDFVGDMVNKSK